MDLPLPFGPWKFRGLPGLILKVADSNNDFLFTATEINRLKEPLPIVKYDFRYTRVTRKKANDFIKKYIADPFVLAKATAGSGLEVRQMVIGGGSVKSEPREYIGLELE